MCYAANNSHLLPVGCQCAATSAGGAARHYSVLHMAVRFGPWSTLIRATGPSLVLTSCVCVLLYEFSFSSYPDGMCRNVSHDPFEDCGKLRQSRLRLDELLHPKLKVAGGH